MNRVLPSLAFLAGLVAIGWVAAGYVGTNAVALATTLLVAAFYLAGGLELIRFRRATSSLATALQALPDPLPALAPWLGTVDPSLRQAVRLRIEGERVALPGPAMAPYLTGLLVLLGMLGTFLGMVVTLRGTGIALETATDLQAIRASLAAPVKGLGLAFGTSVAGVCASAMLGLVTAWARRERIQAGQALDARIGTTLRVFSPGHHRDESLRLLQRQAEALPLLAERLQSMMDRLEQRGEALDARLVASQDRFHAEAQAAYGGLAASVGQSLQHSLGEGARLAGEAIRPVVQSTMSGIAGETAALHQALSSTVREQLLGLSGSFEASTARVAQAWQEALTQQRLAAESQAAQLRAALDGFTTTFEERSAALLNHVRQGQDRWQAALAAQDAERLSGFATALAGQATALQRSWQSATEQAALHQQRIGEALEATAREITTQSQQQARETLAQVERLAAVASEAPRAAAEVIAALREKLSESLARDNAVLEERGKLLHTVNTLLDAVNHASHEQRAAIDALVASSAEVLAQAGQRFGERTQAEAERLAAAATQVDAGAAEVASLGETFGFAVQLFSETNDKLMAQLQRIESALGQSLARSDEQLAYYVAQAREVIDLSLMSQKQIVEDLHQLAAQRPAAALPAEA